jgi:MBOAT, membrane-bound O-acyltransferase family
LAAHDRGQATVSSRGQSRNGWKPGAGWHITLSRFLRDYLYIPLGGNRRGEARRNYNLAATMLIGGLWHGAGWTFVVWGWIAWAISDRQPQLGEKGTCQSWREPGAPLFMPHSAWP